MSRAGPYKMYGRRKQLTETCCSDLKLYPVRRQTSCPAVESSDLFSMRTAECHLWDHQQVQAIQVIRVGPLKDSVRTVQIVVDITDHGRELQACDSHLGRAAITCEEGCQRSPTVRVEPIWVSVQRCQEGGRPTSGFERRRKSHRSKTPGARAGAEFMSCEQGWLRIRWAPRRR